MPKVQASDARGGKHEVTYTATPDRCPLCHHAVTPRTVGHIYSGQAHGDHLHVAFQCTRTKCQRGFLGVYRKERVAGGGIRYDLIRIWPRSASQADFGSELRELSPDFIAIHSQALEAEAHELDQIFGLGLRKALEFLIKDFAVHRQPDQEANIKSSFLGRVIKNHVDDPHVRKCAERAVWIGNDEAHYVRRWSDKDIEDLKILLRLTVNWVENVLLTEKYVSEMPDGNA